MAELLEKQAGWRDSVRLTDGAKRLIKQEAERITYKLISEEVRAAIEGMDIKERIDSYVNDEQASKIRDGVKARLAELSKEIE